MLRTWMCTTAAPALAAATASAAICSGVTGTCSLLPTVSPAPVSAQVMMTLSCMCSRSFLDDGAVDEVLQVLPHRLDGTARLPGQYLDTEPVDECAELGGDRVGVPLGEHALLLSTPDGHGDRVEPAVVGIPVESAHVGVQRALVPDLEPHGPFVPQQPVGGQLQFDQPQQAVVGVVDRVQFGDLTVEGEFHVAAQRFGEHGVLGGVVVVDARRALPA